MHPFSARRSVGVIVGVKMAKLTNKKLQALKPSEIGATLRDDGGLWGKVRKAGEGVSVTFWYRYRWANKTRDCACGTWPAAGLPAIRASRDNARQLVAKGIDPNERRHADKLARQAEEIARKAASAKQASRPTFRTLFEKWEELALSKRKDKGAETRRAFELDVFPFIGDRFAEDVQRADLLNVLDRIVAREANRLANRTLTDMKQLFRWAILRAYVPADPLINVVKKHVGGTEIERERYLSAEELRALPAALASGAVQETTRHVLWIILSTNARIGEVTRARRADIDIDAGVWRIPRENSKNSDPHIVYLSEFAKEHMQALLDATNGTEWLLPAADGKSPADSKSITKQIGDRQVKFYGRQAHSKRTRHENALCLSDERWTPHDLRRTAATQMQALKIAPAVIEACMNHRETNRMMRIYQRHDYADEKRMAWTLLGDRLYLLTQPDISNVVVLPTHSARA
ncbi:tyrosine-type recombinase/integrase [Ralstonia pseudosolanacearum]